jgi:HlyD family secretion protein
VTAGTRWVWLLAVLATAACGAAPPAPTVKIDRGPVAVTVSASGTLASISEQNLGFPAGGQLAEVLVKVGDRVQPGQVLARLDDFALRQTLAQNRAQLASEQANLDGIRSGNAVGAAADSADQAGEILDATEDQVEATEKANSSATGRARKQLSFDRSALDRAEAQLRSDQAACAATAAAPVAGTTTTTTTTNPACDQVATDQSAVQQARGTVLSSQTAVDAAEQKERTDEAAGRLSVENARQGVVSARNDRESAAAERPGDIGEQAGKVRDKQAAVRQAERDVERAVLRAPAAGVVSAINGAAGEFVGAASGTTPLAPGSGARLPDLAIPTGEGVSVTPAPGGDAFMVLDDVASYQLVVPFEESDAVRVTVGQQVQVSVDAVPGLTLPATVIAISPTGDVVSGIVNFYATIELARADPQLRIGQTAEAAVLVESVDNVLRVPSFLVRTEDGRRVVDAPGPDGGDPLVIPFEPGLAGDEFTEVRSGLAEGQELLRPQGQVTRVENNNGGPGQDN